VALAELAGTAVALAVAVTAGFMEVIGVAEGSAEGAEVEVGLTCDVAVGAAVMLAIAEALIGVSVAVWDCEGVELHPAIIVSAKEQIVIAVSGFFIKMFPFHF
jgi:hypothetical protein